MFSALWQAWHLLQSPPQPQGEMPFFLSLTSFFIISATQTSRIAQTRSVPQFSAKKLNIKITSFSMCFQFAIIVLIFSQQHIEHSCKRDNGCGKSDDVNIACEYSANLEHHKGNKISKDALIADCKPSPFCVVHFSFDCADCGKARCTKQVEYQEGAACKSRVSAAELRKVLCKCHPDFVAVFRKLACKVIQNTKCADYVFFCNQTRNSCYGSFPSAPAERCKKPCKGFADIGKDRDVHIVRHMKTAVEGERLKEPDNNG